MIQRAVLRLPTKGLNTCHVLMDLLLGKNEIQHVSHDTVSEFESSILLDSRVRGVRPTSSSVPGMGLWFYKAVDKVNSISDSKIKTTLPVVTRGKSTREFLAVLMGTELEKCFPYFLFPGRKSIYVFDAWRNASARLKNFVETCEVNFLFVTSSQTVERYRASVGDCAVFWIPEGIDPSNYGSRPFAERTIDVLHVGRRYDEYHEMIVEPLRHLNKVYLYEKQRGDLIFPTRAGFIDGLSRSKVSICVPYSISHAPRPGATETMTARYLQSMASRCLVLGHAPDEMVRLFGYNPVVEIDMANPVEQIINILDHYSDFEPLIRRNYEAVTRHHTWSHRWKAIADILWHDATGASSREPVIA
jgi:hypothetical protein